jgi:hypothetical protein
MAWPWRRSCGNVGAVFAMHLQKLACTSKHEWIYCTHKHVDNLEEMLLLKKIERVGGRKGKWWLRLKLTPCPLSFSVLSVSSVSLWRIKRFAREAANSYSRMVLRAYHGQVRYRTHQTNLQRRSLHFLFIYVFSLPHLPMSLDHEGVVFGKTKYVRNVRKILSFLFN